MKTLTLILIFATCAITSNAQEHYINIADSIATINVTMYTNKAVKTIVSLCIAARQDSKLTVNQNGGNGSTNYIVEYVNQTYTLNEIHISTDITGTIHNDVITVYNSTRVSDIRIRVIELINISLL